MDRVISRVDVAVVNDEELEILTGDSNLLRASEALLERGPRAVVIKKGVNGAFIRSRDDYFCLPAYPTDRVSIPPVPATRSRAGSWAISPRAVTLPPAVCEVPSLAALRWRHLPSSRSRWTGSTGWMPRRSKHASGDFARSRRSSRVRAIVRASHPVATYERRPNAGFDHP